MTTMMMMTMMMMTTMTTRFQTWFRSPLITRSLRRRSQPAHLCRRLRRVLPILRRSLLPEARFLTAGPSTPARFLGGLALASTTGVISGSPSTSGIFNFTVRISDGSQPTPQTATKAFSLVVSAAAPVVSSIDPSARPAGSPAFTLTVNGNNFVSGSTVRWNGANRTTTFVNSSQLTAAIPASDIVTSGTAGISVLNPGPTSNSLTFTISPGLTITTNSPLPQGTTGTSYSRTLTAAGGTAPYTWSIAAGALPGGLALSSSTGVISGIPSTSGTFNFTVRVSDGSQALHQTATKAFSLVVSAAVPVLSSINPSRAFAGSSAFTLTVSGTHFVSGSTVRWNGANRTTTFISVSQLTAAISASDVASRGAATVTVANPVGSASNALTFTISPPVLNITTSATLPGGDVGTAYSQTLSATGGQPPYSWSVVAGSLPAGLALAPTTGVLSGTPSAAGIANFTVAVSDDGVQATAQTTTKAFTLAVTSSEPVLNSLNPSSAIAGGPAFTLTVGGNNFASGSIVAWNGVNRTTTFVSSSQLTAAIPAADIVALGTASINVLNPGPRTSNALIFTISGTGLTITTNSPLPQGTVGSSYTQTLAASGGAPPYSWSVTSGSLPAGLTLASSGTIDGIASATGSSTFTLQVRDSASSTATKQFQLSIASTTGLTITTNSPLPQGTVGSSYTQTLAASGGAPPYSWSVTSGSLPAGLTLKLQAGPSMVQPPRREVRPSPYKSETALRPPPRSNSSFRLLRQRRRSL